MSPSIGLPPPSPETCLVTSRVSRFKGGTLIDHEVRDLETHERRLCDPDGYRPGRCPRCGHCVLHVHCYPERHPRGELGMPAVVRIVQYVDILEPAPTATDGTAPRKYACPRCGKPKLQLDYVGMWD